MEWDGCTVDNSCCKGELCGNSSRLGWTKVEQSKERIGFCLALFLQTLMY